MSFFTYLGYFTAAVGIIVIVFFIAIFIIATVKVIKHERSIKNRTAATEKLGCGEKVFAVLINKKGEKEIIQ